MDSDVVRAACPACRRLLKADDEVDAEATVVSHNTGRHGGEDVAFILYETHEDMARYLNEVKEHNNLEEYKKLHTRMRSGESEVFVTAADYKKIRELVDHDTRQYQW